MIKPLTSLEIAVGERVYKLICAIDSPLGEVHDVLIKMKEYVVGAINEAHRLSQASPSQNEESCKEECQKPQDA